MIRPWWLISRPCRVAAVKIDEQWRGWAAEVDKHRMASSSDDEQMNKMLMMSSSEQMNIMMMHMNSDKIYWPLWLTMINCMMSQDMTSDKVDKIGNLGTLMISITAVKNDEQRRGWEKLWPTIVMSRVDWLMMNSVDEHMIWQWAHLTVICVCDEYVETVSCNCKSKLILLLRLGYLKPFLAESWMKSRCSLYQ